MKSTSTLSVFGVFVLAGAFGIASACPLDDSSASTSPPAPVASAPAATTSGVAKAPAKSVKAASNKAKGTAGPNADQKVVALNQR
jgi:hypothetical protein